MDPDIHNDFDDQLHRWPTPSEAMEEIKEIGKISGPTAITGLLLYSRAMISMLFLGYLGELELAGGSLSIGFANITGYSVISGLAMGMEPICGQAYGAKQKKLLGLTLQRTVLLLLSISIPISFMWLNMNRILLWCGQDQEISAMAHTFIIFTIPDLFFLSLLHPLRIYLPNSKHHLTSHLLLFNLRSSPHPIELPPRGLFPNGYFRRGDSNGVDKSQSVSASVDICLLLRRVQGLVGGPERRLPARVVLPPRLGHPHLRLGLPRVVVVRVHDHALRPLVQPKIHNCFHGYFDSNNFTGIRIPVCFIARGLHPDR
ncbi:hypothetical protein Vadar_021540 [Vaccinium darrowii]|uniref:Uncharacterized protein n=1 Tax=Vaccinium darrowii TaxID=229202 RepID=A0ACB7Y8E7_9ERIC|nr:hypothetical protein Vadar_021540 [Vaccinium darrowii]